MGPQKLLLFARLTQAKAHRHNNGTGGWIFEPDDKTDCILFPPDYYPMRIFHHPITKGRGGHLHGSQ